MGTIIGLSGKAGSGKDTVAGMLPPHFRRHAFASSLKNAASVMFGWSGEQLNNQSFKAQYFDGYRTTPRTAMQKLGVWARDNFGEDFWIKRLFAVEGFDHDHVAHVITDVRFQNEADAIRARGGYVVRINRNGLPQMDHISETALDNYKFDLVLENNGSLTALKHQVNLMLTVLEVPTP